MTEDDTFNALKKLPFDQLLALVGGYPIDEYSATVDEIIMSHGWTLGEFFHEYDTRWAP